MNDLEEIIVRILAASDAARLPIRNWDVPFPQNRCAALKSLESLGVAYRVGGDAGTRKTGETRLAELEQTPWVTITRTRGTRYPWAKLTAEGEFFARALAGVSSWGYGREFLERIAERTTRNGKTLEKVFLDETAISTDLKELALFEQDFVLCAARGWCETRSSIRGHVRYRVTPAGWQELDSPTAPPMLELPGFSRDAAKLYRQHQDAILAEWSSAEPETRSELGEIPQPVSMGGLPV
jgi:hypothetical protein